MKHTPALIPVVFLLVVAAVYPTILISSASGNGTANQLGGALPANAPRLGYWLQEGDIMKGTWQGGYNSGGTDPAQLFFDTMFLTPPYPSSVEIMIFSIIQDESSGLTPGAAGSYTASSISFWSNLASLAQAYPNIRLVYEIAFDPTNGATGTYGLPAFEMMVNAFGQYSGVYAMGVEGEYTKPASSLTTAEMQTAMGYVTATGKQFISYYVSQSVIPSGGYDIYHTNFPGGDSGGYDQVGSLQMYDSHTVGMDSGYYAPFAFPGTLTCPIAASAVTASTAGWNQCVVSTELSTALSMPAGTRDYLELDPGFDASGTFVGVSGVTTNQLWDNPTLRNWIWTDSNYQGNFILSTTPASSTTSSTSASTTTSSTHSTTTSSTHSTTTSSTSSTHSTTTTKTSSSTTSTSTSTRSTTSSTSTRSSSTSRTSSTTTSSTTSTSTSTPATSTSTTTTTPAQLATTTQTQSFPSHQTTYEPPPSAALSVNGGCPATGAGTYAIGSTATVEFGGVCDRDGASGLRVTGWSLDDDAPVQVLTNGTTEISVAMDSPHAITLFTVKQFSLTLDYGAQLSVLSLTQPSIPGDSGWYDAGTVVTYVGGYSFNGTVASAWSLDGAAPAQVGGAPDFIASFPMSSPHTLSVVLAQDAPACNTGRCQSAPSVDVTVQTNVDSPAGAWVDGAYYPRPVTFAWPEGSNHNITAEAGLVKSSVKTSFIAWAGLSNSTSPSLMFTVAQGGNLTADYQKLYLVTLDFTDANGAPVIPQGVVVSGPTGQQHIGANLSAWAAAGVQYRLSSVTWMNWNVVTANDSIFKVVQPASLSFPLQVYQESIRATDVYGLPLQGASVNVTALDGAHLQVATDSQGVAIFRVPLGLFSATVSYLGVSSQVVAGTQGAHSYTATFVLSYPLLGTFAAVSAVAAGILYLTMRKKPEGGPQYFSD